MVFDPEKISLIVAGAKVTGYADGSKVSAEHNKDAVTPTTGIQGDTVYALNADRSGTIKFTLFGSSASLVRLRRLAQDRAQVAVTLRNANDDGGFIISHQDCRILKVPKFGAATTAAPLRSLSTSRRWCSETDGPQARHPAAAGAFTEIQRGGHGDMPSEHSRKVV